MAGFYMKRNNEMKWYPISGLCSHFVAPENIRKPFVFWGHKMGTLARNRLTVRSVSRQNFLSSACLTRDPRKNALSVYLYFD